MLNWFQIGATEELGSLAGSLQVVIENLTSQRGTLDQLDGMLAQAAGISGEIDDSLTAVTPLLDDMAIFLGDQLPVTLDATEASLRSASDGAAAIDSILRLLSRIPFLGSFEYDPTQPLDANLVQAADGIAPLGAPLVQLQDDLNQFSAALKEMRSEMGGTEQTLADFRGELTGFKQSIEIVSEALEALTSSVTKLKARVPGVIPGIGLFLGSTLVWFGLVSILLIIQGLSLVRGLSFQEFRWD